MFLFKLNKSAVPKSPLFISFAPTPKRYPKNGLFRCQNGNCKNEFITRIRNIQTGATKSCGCYNKQVAKKTNYKHGHSVRKLTSKTYETWQNMIQRCYNSNTTDYKDYGGRGIKVCKRWHKFENFLEDMGERPDNLTIERTNNELGYSKDNCIWTGRFSQSINKRTTIFVVYEDNKISLIEAYKKSKSKVPYGTVVNRISQYNWALQDALFKPVIRRLGHGVR